MIKYEKSNIIIKHFNYFVSSFEQNTNSEQGHREKQNLGRSRIGPGGDRHAYKGSAAVSNWLWPCISLQYLTSLV